MKRFWGILVVIMTVMVLSAPFTPVRAGETKVQSSAKQTARININTADAKELATLKGIGEKKAQAIVDFRSENGPFKKVEDIMLVKGIGQKLFTTIQNQIAVK